MAVLTGFYIADVEQPDFLPMLSDNLQQMDFTETIVTVTHFMSDPADGGSAVTDNLPVSENPWVITSHDVPSYYDDFYNRIHIIPRMIDLGNLVADVSHTVEVWNAYPVVKNLASVTASGIDGLSLDEPSLAPTDFSPLESRLYTMNATQQGAPSIDASWSFAFPDETPVLYVVGDRVITWAFPPNWREPVLERLSWKTDVLLAMDGTEQRRALRDVPRRDFEFRVTSQGDAMRRLEAMLFDWQGRVFALPVFTDPHVLSAPLAVDDFTIPVTTTYRDYQVDGLVVVMNNTGQAEALEIEAVAADSVTLKSGITQSWPMGARVYPARLSRLNDTQSVGRYTADVTDMMVGFSCQENSNITAVDSPTIYRSLPVLEIQPNWRDDISAEYHRRMTIFDNQTGIRGYEDETGQAITMLEHLWTLGGREAIHSLKAWLHAREGQLTPIWIPTWIMDLMLVSVIDAAESVIRVTHCGYTNHLLERIGRRDIVITLIDGTRFYRRITAASVESADIEQLTIDAVLGQDVAPDDVRMISFIQVCRLNADSLEFAWHTAEVMECRHQLRGQLDDV